MQEPLPKKEYLNSSYLTPPYKNIFGAPFDPKQFSSPSYYIISDKNGDNPTRSEIQFVLGLDDI